MRLKYLKISGYFKLEDSQNTLPHGLSEGNKLGAVQQGLGFYLILGLKQAALVYYLRAQ